MKIEDVTKIKKAVIDASVAVKWFNQEPQVETAEAILAHATAGETYLSVPDLLFYEVGNALFKGKRFNEAAMTDALDTLLEAPFDLHILDKDLGRSVIALMVKYNLTFYDAAYAGLASKLDIPLITANPKDHQKIKEITIISL